MTPTPWPAALPCLACPHCASALQLADGGVLCARGHRFDLARDGYLHLLPGTARPSAATGDSRAMLRARRAFLGRGYYDPIADALAAQAAASLTAPVDLPGCVLDAGCGEGYYLAHIQSHLSHLGAVGLVPPPLIGLDIAKDAARLAARGHPGLAIVVADVTARLPVRDASARLLLSVFAPRNPAEFARIVAPHGRLLAVIPAADHLSGLRAHVSLLRVEPAKREHIQDRLAGAFTLTGAFPLRYFLTLPGPDAANLVAMSPTARHLPPAQLAALASQPDPITTPVSIELLTFERTA